MKLVLYLYLISYVDGVSLWDTGPRVVSMVWKESIVNCFLSLLKATIEHGSLYFSFLLYMQWVSISFILGNASRHQMIKWLNRWIHIVFFLSSWLFFIADYVPCIGGEVRCRGWAWAFVYWDHVLQQLFVSPIFVVSHYSYGWIPEFFIIIICKGQFLVNPSNFCQTH